MKAPVQSRSEDSTDKMVDATLALAETDGLRAVTIARIAALSGCSNGALYHRFANREGLLAAASARMLAQIEAQMQAAMACIGPELSDLAALRALVAANRAVFEQHAGVLRAFMIEGRSIDALAKQGFGASQNVGRDVIAWLTARFDCPPARANAAFRLLFSAGALMLVVADDRHLTHVEVGPEEAINDLAEILLRQLR
ncbi:MAG: TetR/AcrR family transcriptional regulator [Paracoccaceae bacterium]